jgi:hypothetical protein
MKLFVITAMLFFGCSNAVAQDTCYTVELVYLKPSVKTYRAKWLTDKGTDKTKPEPGEDKIVQQFEFYTLDTLHNHNVFVIDCHYVVDTSNFLFFFDQPEAQWKAMLKKVFDRYYFLLTERAKLQDYSKKMEAVQKEIEYFRDAAYNVMIDVFYGYWTAAPESGIFSKWIKILYEDSGNADGTEATGLMLAEMFVKHPRKFTAVVKAAAPKYKNSIRWQLKQGGLQRYFAFVKGDNPNIEWTYDCQKQLQLFDKLMKGK